MKNIVISMFGFALALIISIWVMMYGWGIEPKSWGWIIGGGVGLRALVFTIESLAKNDK